MQIVIEIPRERIANKNENGTVTVEYGTHLLEENVHLYLDSEGIEFLMSKLGWLLKSCDWQEFELFTDERAGEGDLSSNPVHEGRILHQIRVTRIPSE